MGTTLVPWDGKVQVDRHGCRNSDDAIAYQINGPENSNCPCNIVYVDLTTEQALRVCEAIIEDIAKRRGFIIPPPCGPLDPPKPRKRKAVKR